MYKITILKLLFLIFPSFGACVWGEVCVCVCVCVWGGYGGGCVVRKAALRLWHFLVSSHIFVYCGISWVSSPIFLHTFWT